MIAAIIFGFHVVGVVYAFVSRRKTGGTADGILAVAFVIIIFAVGWTVSTMIVSLVLEPDGFGLWFDRDTVSLVLLTVGEAVFYYLLLKGEKDGKRTGEEGSEKST